MDEHKQIARQLRELSQYCATDGFEDVCVKAADLLEKEYNVKSEKVETKTIAVLSLIHDYGGIDGAHHKQWLLDQILRVLTEDNYHKWVTEFCVGEDGPDTYEWDTGIAP